MPGRLTQGQFETLSRGFEKDLEAFFMSIEADVNEVIDKHAGESPDEIINKINSILTNKLSGDKNAGKTNGL